MLFLVLWDKLVGKAWVIIGNVLVACGLLGRFNAAILFVPFCVLEVLFYLYQKRPAKALKIFIPTVAILVLIFSVDKIVQSSDFYAPAMQYDEARIAILDYPVKPYEEIKEEIPDISENDYNLILGWKLFDTDKITTQVMEEIAQEGKTTVPIQDSVLKIKEQLTQVQPLVILTGAMLVAAFASCGNAEKLKIACSVGGMLVISMYFAVKGRYIDRVAIPLLLCCLLIGTLTLLTQAKEHKSLWYILAAIIVTVGGVQAYKLPIHTWNMQLAVTAKSDFGNENKEDDTIYIEHTRIYHRADGRMVAGKLPEKSFLQHNISPGDWPYGQVYFQQHLKDMGLTNPMYDLLERPNTYFVDESSDLVLTYLREHYNPDVQCRKVGEKDNTPVWQFYVSEDK